METRLGEFDPGSILQVPRRSGQGLQGGRWWIQSRARRGQGVQGSGSPRGFMAGAQ